MKFGIICLNGFKTALFLAVENQNVEIVSLLLSNNKIDVNIKCIFTIKLF